MNEYNEKDEFNRWHRALRLHRLDTRRVTAARIAGPGFLALLRLVLFAYTLTVWISAIVYDAQHGAMSGHFAYFTYLCYTGLVAYFASALVHTASACRGRATFTRMPRVLRLLHWLLFESVLVYAVVVSVLFWAVLYDAQAYAGGRHRWLNASVHAGNVAGIMVDAAAGGMALSGHWSHVLALEAVALAYVALAYVNRAANGWFVYGFLDYERLGWRVLGIIVGLLAALAVIYYVLPTISR
ncbi:hypothetical protein IWW55_002907 [Coemansia sp. RSA 2706]|nr:hypothetical protein IWW55_002907 [Coemansia sp. RSA 2706]